MGGQRQIEAEEVVQYGIKSGMEMRFELNAPWNMGNIKH